MVRLFVSALVLVSLAAQDLTQKEADTMAVKVDAMEARAAKALPATAPPLKTTFTEREASAYLKFKAELPTGIVNPQVMILGGDRIEARAIVDIDIVRKSKQRSLFDPMNYLGGTVELRASGSLRGVNGTGTLVIDSTSVAGVPVPKSLLQEIVHFYVKSLGHPNGFDLDKPFPLPVGIRQLEMQKGVAIVVQ